MRTSSACAYRTVAHATEATEGSMHQSGGIRVKVQSDIHMRHKQRSKAPQPTCALPQDLYRPPSLTGLVPLLEIARLAALGQA